MAEAHGEIRFIGDMQRLEVKPGDRFVVKADRALPMEAMKFLQQHVANGLGCSSSQVLVIDNSLSLGIIGQEQEA